jgi:uncharacterized caspase-like protein
MTQQRMKDVILEFSQRLNAGGVGLFYFAGHGFQIGDKALLAPVDSDSDSPGRLIATSIDLKSVLAGMSASRPGKRNLIILDTCLNNPFHTGNEGSFDLPGQTLIAYATAPGSFAADAAEHGLYTAELVRALAVPGRDIMELFANVGAAVSQATNRQQIPWVSSSLSGEFRLATASPRVSPSPASTGLTAVVTMHSRGILPKDSAYELAFWESIKDSTHASDYEAYLEAYPNGRFAGLAKARIERLLAAAPKSETAPEQPRPTTTPEMTPKQTQPPPAQKRRRDSPAALPRHRSGPARRSRKSKTAPRVRRSSDCRAEPTRWGAIWTTPRNGRHTACRSALRSRSENTR